MAIITLKNNSLSNISSLPNGIVDANALASGVGGKVLQIQYNNTNNFLVQSSWSPATLVSVNITPSSTANKIILIGTIGEPDQMDARLWGRFYRDNTELTYGRFCSEFGRNLGYSGTETHFANVAHSYVDAPSSTSQITYSIKINNGLQGSTVRVGNGGSSNIMAIEVA